MKNKTVLIIEDEPTIQRVVATYFKKEGYNVFTADDGFSGLEKFNQEKIDIICLDIMMPNIDGWVVAETIRSTSDVPIIIMTALSEDEDVLKGYSFKVDDYITKPFNPKILIAKVNNLLDRIEKAKSESVNTFSKILISNNIKIDLESHKVSIDEKYVDFSKTEYDLLVFFIKNKGKICSRDLLLDEVWGYDSFVEDRIVDTYIKRLRKLITPYSHYIKTVFGVGYRYEDDPEINE